MYVIFENPFIVLSYIGGEDYDSGPFSITIPARENTVSYNITIINDNVFEASESFNLTISTFSLPNRVLVQSICMLMVTIVDDDGELNFKLKCFCRSQN